MGGKNSKTKEEDRSVNNIAPVQTIRVDNEMNDLSTHDIVLYVLVILLASILIFFGITVWCRRNSKKRARLERQVEELQALRDEVSALKKCVSQK